MQHIAIGFAQGVADDFVAYEAAINENILRIFHLAGTGGVDDVPRQAQGTGGHIKRAGGAKEVFTQHIRNAPVAFWLALTSTDICWEFVPRLETTVACVFIAS